jgi:hypothetical protein
VPLPRAAAGPEVLVRDDTALGLDDLVHTRSNPERFSVMRAFESAPTNAQVFSVRYHTSLGVPWPKIQRESPYCVFAIYKITYFLVPESTKRFQLIMFFLSTIHNCEPLPVVQHQTVSS